jgi:KaiC/GvpD/RAD55 family RecA-like ATPase
MEDIMKALLDVVRAQHSATEGSEEKPFDINDIIDMAMNITGRPEEPAEQRELSDTIQKMAESMAPDIFPPKTFEEMDDSERAASAVNMIEERLKNGGRRREEAQQPVQPVQAPEAVSQPEPEPVQPQVQAEAISASQPETEQQPFNNEDYGNGNAYDMFGQDDVNPQEAANLNDLIYNNFMQMMGLNDPKVEYPFDRSQIRYGREKTATEMLAEDEANQAEERALEEQRRRPVSAWELAQAAVDKDEEAHQKEEYEPKEMQMPETKSASQLAAEAIAKAREEDQMKLEAEKRAELLMEEARKRGKDPMEFALHQQEILNYMEKNSDELVSFEDYEDLSPEEKLEIERELYKEKQLEAGVAPEDITDVPDEIKEQVGVLPQQAQSSQAELQQDGTGEAASDATAQGTEQTPAFSDDMLRMISQEVVQENADMILSEDANADLGVINETIFENLKRMMSQSGGTVSQEDMESLIGEVISRNTSETPSVEESNVLPEEPEVAAVPQETPETGAVSAVELARAAQQAARPEPQEVRETKSAVDIAKEAQEIEALKKALAAQEKEEELSEDDLSFDELDLDDDAEDTVDTVATQSEPQPEALEEASKSEQKPNEELEVKLEAETEQKIEAETEQKEEKEESEQEAEARTQGDSVEPVEAEEVVSETEQPEETALVEEKPEESDEYEYVDPGELVLGEHTQAEIDEALDNLASLGLEGDVYERAKRMLLLELAGSETVLDAWLEEQENGKKKKATVSALDKEEDTLGDLEDLDEDDLERELEIAMDEDFVEEELEEDSTEDSEEPTVENVESTEETGAQDNTDSEETEKLNDTERMENTEASEDSAENISAEEASTEEVNTESADQEDFETLENSKDSKESERSALSDDEDEKAGDETVQKDTEKESETAEYISESEHTIQVEKTRPEKEEKKSARVKKDSRSERSLHSRKHKNVVKRKEKAAPEKEEREFTAVIPTGKTVEEKEFQVSVRNPFVLKNSASFMDKFEEYIVDTQENRKLSTGFKRLDAMLRYGLHKGSYFVDSMPQYLKNGFMQQIADRAAESGVDVLYISTELSRYDLMVDTVSRLSYEMNKKDEEKAVSSMAIMTGEKGADIRSLKDELNWYRGRISEHLFVLDQEAVSEYVDNMEDASASDILEELIRSIVTEGAHKPVVFIDNIENILSVEDSEDMKPLMDGIRKLAKELGIPILMSYGYAQAESESELDPDEIAFHESLGNMCDVYLELKYADMITEDYEELTEEDIEEMVENGEMLLINVLLHKNRRTMKASCQIQATPKFNYYEE